MKTDLEILEEIRKDFVAKFDNDPQINLVCKMMINEFKQRKEQYAINGVSQQRELLLDLLRFNEEYFEKTNCEWLSEEVLDEWLKSKNCG